MSSRVSAARYARALFDVALKESKPDLLERELTACVQLLRHHPELQTVLTTPGVPVAGKRGILHALAQRAGFSSPMSKLLMMLADRDRLWLLPELREVFRERLMEHQQVARAEVTTATPLPPEDVARLERRISAATRRRVTITATVDASLIGGVVARIGSTVYDGSVATQLARIREQLVKQA